MDTGVVPSVPQCSGTILPPIAESYGTFMTKYLLTVLCFLVALWAWMPVIMRCDGGEVMSFLKIFCAVAAVASYVALIVKLILDSDSWKGILFGFFLLVLGITFEIWILCAKLP